MLDTIKKLLYLLPNTDRIKLVGLFFMMLFGAVLEVIGVGIIPVFVSIVAAPDRVLEIAWLKPVWNMFGIETGGDLLVYGAILLIGIFIVKNAYIVFYKYIQARFIWNRFSTIGSNLFQKYMAAPYTFHLNRNSSGLLRNVTQEAQILANNVMTPLLRLIMDIVLITAIIVLLFSVEPLITIIVTLLLGGVGGLFLKIIKKKTRVFGKQGQEERQRMIKAVNEGLGGFKEARVLNREGWFARKFRYYIKSYSRSQTFREVASVSSGPIIETIAVSGMLLIALILFFQGRGLDSVIPVLTLFGAAPLRLMPAIKNSTKEFTTLRYYGYSVEPIYDHSKLLTEENNQNIHIISENDKLSLSEKIEFERVGYSYSGSDIPAVDDISLQITKGTAAGFVGPSGAGKTTLMDLLLGLLKPHTGKIMVDGSDIYENLKSWQRSVGYIPQFIFLSDDTLKNNIAFGLPGSRIENDKLISTIEAAQLSELVETLPEGVDTIVGERGTRLSGGQRQRIGIARALYHNPDVLLMDEATSALDNITERFVIDAVDRLKGERTIIMIAHRLTTVQNCDVIYFLKHGRVVDYGNYDELILRNQEFKKMALVE